MLWTGNEAAYLLCLMSMAYRSAVNLAGIPVASLSNMELQWIIELAWCLGG